MVVVSSCGMIPSAESQSSRYNLLVQRMTKGHKNRPTFEGSAADFYPPPFPLA